ncbi:MAG: hypothetical protein AAGK28_16865, partial [Pseudomonadota bacterium]
DGTGTIIADPRTATAELTFTITPANDGPVQSVPATPGGVPVAATTTLEDTVLVFSAGNGNALTVSDADSASVTTVVSVVHGTLTITDATTLGGFGATLGGDGTDTITLSGTPGEVSAALEGLTYTPLADFNTTTPLGGGTAETLTITTDDGEGEANSVSTDTVAIGVAAVADLVDDAVTTNVD